VDLADGRSHRGRGAPDSIHVDENGRITSVTAFLDQAPAGFDPAGAC
jgi:hypothetical protein